MYFVEKINDGEGKLIRRNYVDNAGKNQTESIALCYSEKIASIITDFMNIYENLSKKREFIMFMDNVIEILSFLTNMGHTYKETKEIFSKQIEEFFNNLEKMMYKTEIK